MEGWGGGTVAHCALQPAFLTRRVAARAPVVIALIAALVYANGLSNGFTQDDWPLIAHNPIVQSFTGLWRAFAHPYWPKAWGWGQYRPVAVGLFVLQWAAAGGSPSVYHGVSIVLHVSVCLLLRRVLMTMVPPPGATIGAAWFALQPVHVEAVASAVGQSELLSTAFVLAAWLAHWREKRIAMVWFALALLAKETGIVFLGLAIVHDLMQGGARAPLARRRALYLRYGAVVVLYAVVLATIFSDQPLRVVAQTWDGATAGARLLTMLSVAPDYARLVVMPFVLRTNYEPQVIALQTALTPPVFLGGAFVIAVIIAVIMTRRRAPAICYGIAWFVMAVAPVANVFFATGVVLAERTLYLPTAGAAIVIGGLAARARPRLRVAALATAFGLAFAVRVWTRTRVWHDDLALTRSALHDSPRSYKAHHAAAMFLASTGQWTAAAGEYRLARQLFPRDGDPYRGGAEAALAARDYEGAAALLDSARRLAPTQIGPWLRLADVRALQRRWREAGALAFAAYELCPDSVRAIRVAATMAVRSGNPVAARTALRRGLADHPGNADLHRAYIAVRDTGP